MVQVTSSLGDVTATMVPRGGVCDSLSPPVCSVVEIECTGACGGWIPAAVMQFTITDDVFSARGGFRIVQDAPQVTASQPLLSDVFEDRLGEKTA